MNPPVFKCDHQLTFIRTLQLLIIEPKKKEKDNKNSVVGSISTLEQFGRKEVRIMD